jgi:hypothetical protein
MLHVIIISINSHNSLCIRCYMQDLFLSFGIFKSWWKFQQISKIFPILWYTFLKIWIKDALGIKSEHQNGEGTKKVNVFHNMWRLNSMELETIIY